jgi:hypothetical protein
MILETVFDFWAMMFLFMYFSPYIIIGAKDASS